MDLSIFIDCARFWTLILELQEYMFEAKVSHSPRLFCTSYLSMFLSYVTIQIVLDAKFSFFPF